MDENDRLVLKQLSSIISCCFTENTLSVLRTSITHFSGQYPKCYAEDKNDEKLSDNSHFCYLGFTTLN